MQCVEDPVVVQKFYDMVISVTYKNTADYGADNLAEDAMFERIVKEQGIGDKY